MVRYALSMMSPFVASYPFSSDAFRFNLKKLDLMLH